MSWILLLLSCDELNIDDMLDPPEPEYLEVTVDCVDDLLSVEALVQSAYDVSNVVIERTDIDETDLEPLFPTLDVSAIGGKLTRWALETEHDCDESFLSTWTAYTILESSVSTEVAWPDVDLSSGPIDPPYGSDAGGSMVEITGTDMEYVTGIWFGETEGTIASATDKTLTVLTPAGTTGLVDVTVAAGVTETILKEAFTYYPDATGTITGFSQMVSHVYSTSWYSIGSAYVTLDPYGPFVQLEVILQEPVLPEDAYPDNAYPEAGTCSNTSSEWTAVDVGSYVTFSSDDLGSLAMLSNGNDTPVYYYVESDTDPEVWSGQKFALTLPAEVDQFPAMTIEDALLIPTLPTDASFDYQVSSDLTWGEDVTFTWTDTSAQRVRWTLYPAQGYSVLGSVTCMADASTGELTVSWAALTADVDEDSVTTLFAQLVFIEDELVILPHDNSEFWSMGITNHWLYFSVTE